MNLMVVPGGVAGARIPSRIPRGYAIVPSWCITLLFHFCVIPAFANFVYTMLSQSEWRQNEQNSGIQKTNII